MEFKAMREHRVLLLSAHPLLSEGLANVLGNMEDLILIGPYAVSDFALSDLSTFAPDVVLFAEQETNDAAATAVLFQILQHDPDLPLIRIGLSGTGRVRVYTSRTLPERSSDLVEMIRSLPVQEQRDKADDA
jgi:DNA-binding NarL/FixJ family response regulator